MLLVVGRFSDVWSESYNVGDQQWVSQTLSHPQTEHAPSASIESTALVAVSDHGRCDPTIAQANPSKMRYFVRLTTSAGTSESCKVCIHSLRSRVMGDSVVDFWSVISMPVFELQS